MDRKCEPLAGRASSGSRAHLIGCLSVDYASASAARSRHLHRPLSKQKLLSGQSARHTISGRTASAQCQSLVEVQQLPKPLMSKATLRVWLPACECATCLYQARTITVASCEGCFISLREMRAPAHSQLSSKLHLLIPTALSW